MTAAAGFDIRYESLQVAFFIAKSQLSGSALKTGDKIIVPRQFLPFSSTPELSPG